MHLHPWAGAHGYTLSPLAGLADEISNHRHSRWYEEGP